MIRINLLGEKKDNRALYALQLLIFGGFVAIALFTCMALHFSAASDLSNVESERSLLESRAQKLREKTKTINELEAKRKLLAEKLMTISTLKAKKQGPVRVLDNITTTIPERAWLLKLNQKGDVLEFNGVALDNQTIAHFIKDLTASPYFTSVDLVYSKEYMKENVGLVEFLLSARLGNMLKLNLKSKPAQSEAETKTIRGGKNT